MKTDRALLASFAKLAWFLSYLMAWVLFIILNAFLITSPPFLLSTITSRTTEWVVLSALLEFVVMHIIFVKSAMSIVFYELEREKLHQEWLSETTEEPLVFIQNNKSEEEE